MKNVFKNRKPKLNNYQSSENNSHRTGFMPYAPEHQIKPELTKSPQITTFQPRRFDDEVDEIANHLIKFKQIKLNLTNMEKPDRLRTIDFISGIIYAFHGRVEVTGHHQYLFLI